jgi:hypothetical protein
VQEIKVMLNDALGHYRRIREAVLNAVANPTVEFRV